MSTHTELHIRQSRLTLHLPNAAPALQCGAAQAACSTCTDCRGTLTHTQSAPLHCTTTNQQPATSWQLTFSPACTAPAAGQPPPPPAAHQPPGNHRPPPCITARLDAQGTLRGCACAAHAQRQYSHHRSASSGFTRVSHPWSRPTRSMHSTSIACGGDRPGSAARSGCDVLEGLPRRRVQPPHHGLDLLPRAQLVQLALAARKQRSQARLPAHLQRAGVVLGRFWGVGGGGSRHVKRLCMRTHVLARAYAVQL